MADADDEMNQQVDSKAGSYRDLLLIGGTALFVAWLMLVFFSSLFIDAGESAMPWPLVECLCFLGGSAVGSALLFASRMLFHQMAHHEAVIIFAICAALPGVKGILALFGIVLPLWATIVIWVLAGSSAAVFLSTLGSLYLDLEELSVTKFSLIGVIIAALVYLTVANLTLVAARVMLVALPILSFLLQYLVGVPTLHTGETDDEDTGLPYGVNEVSPGLFLYSFALGAAISILYEPALMSGSSTILSIALALAGGVLAISYPMLMKAGYLHMPQWSLYVLIVLAFMLMPFIEGTGKVILCAIAIIGFIYYATMNWIIIINIAHINESKANVVINMTRAIGALGIAVGMGLALALWSFPSMRDEVDTYLSLVTVLLTAICLVFMWWIKARKRQETETLQTGKWKVCGDQASEDFGLSKREQEVFMFLVRGRDAQYIEKTLYVSRSTVKTHINHIYRKTGVHSQQELMDLFEMRYLGR